MMSWITSIYEWRLCTTLTWSNLNPMEWQTRSKVPCVLKFEPSPLQSPLLHSGSSPALPFTYWARAFTYMYLPSARGRSIFEKYLNSHFHCNRSSFWRKHSDVFGTEMCFILCCVIYKSTLIRQHQHMHVYNVTNKSQTGCKGRAHSVSSHVSVCWCAMVKTNKTLRSS